MIFLKPIGMAITQDKLNKFAVKQQPHARKKANTVSPHWPLINPLSMGSSLPAKEGIEGAGA